MTPTFTFLDLFAGVGGFHHALSVEAFGGECVLAVELDAYCRDVYGEAFPATRIEEDVRGITRRRTPEGQVRDATPEEIAQEVPSHDVLCAGFPCQPFSKSGAQLGLRDQTRGTLFFDIMEIVRAKLPKFLILENVPNLVGPNHRNTWALMIATIREAGYRVSGTPVVVSPHRLPPGLGAPQVRERVFILAHHDPDHASDDIAPLVDRKRGSPWKRRSWTLDGLIEHGEPAEAYKIRPVERTWLNAWDAFVREIPVDDLPGFPLWVDAWTDSPAVEIGMPDWKVRFLEQNSAFYVANKSFIDKWLARTWKPEMAQVADFPASRRKFEWQARTVHATRAGRTIWDLLIQLRPSGIRVKAADYFPALVAINQTSIVGELERRITPREAARLQGIPFGPFERAGLPDSAIYRQLGNAVNVGVIQYLAALLFNSAGETWGASLLLPVSETGDGVAQGFWDQASPDSSPSPVASAVS